MNLSRALRASVVIVVCCIWGSAAIAQQDSSGLKYELKDKKPGEDAQRNLIDFKTPPNIKTLYQYDAKTGNYLEIITIGGRPVGSPRVLTLTEYMRGKERRDREVYYRKKSNADNYIKGGGLIPKIAIAPEIFDKVFGGGIIDIRPTGSAEVTFGGNYNKVENPTYPVRQQRN